MKKIACEVYSRVVGYYRPVQSWNPGKQAEFADRTVFVERDGSQVLVRIYSHPFCESCQKAKEAFKQAGIHFVDVDVRNRSALLRLEALGLVEVDLPVITETGSDGIEKVVE